MLDPVEATVAAYAHDALAYASATAEYSSFPGLLSTLEGLLVQVPDGGTIVDLGCGGGRDSRYLAAHGYQVIALDLCAPLLATWANRQLERVQPLVADMRHLPLADSAVDGALATASIIHLDPSEIPVVMAEIARTLVPGGHLGLTLQREARSGWIASGPVQRSRWFSPLDELYLSECLVAAGFGQVTASMSGPDWLALRATKV